MTYGLTKRQSDCTYIALHLPGWDVRFDGFTMSYIARSPRFEEDAVEIRHTKAEEVVALAHVLMLNWTPGSGLGEEVQRAPARPPVVREEDSEPRPRLHVEPPSGMRAYTGECCTNCGSAYVVRTGSCSTCQACGTTTSCG